MAKTEKTTEAKAKAPVLFKPFKAGEYAVAIARIAGCNTGDYAKVTGISGIVIKGEFVTGVKAGKEFSAFEDALNPMAPKALPANIRSILKIKD